MLEPWHFSHLYIPGQWSRSIHPSIHPSILNCLSEVGSWRQQFQQQGAPDFPFPGHISQFWLGDPRDIISPPGCWSAPGPVLNWTCLEHLPREVTSRHPYQMPDHLNCLLSAQRSSGSTPSSSWMTELLNSSQKVTPPTLLRKPIIATCICALILSVMTHS